LLVLLPPSEGKTAPARRGRSLDLSSLAFADELTSSRAQVLSALGSLCAGPVDAAAAALGLSAGQVDEVARNAALSSAPTARASAVYTGVLFERLQLPSLPVAARRRVLVFSALWGVVRPDDRIPAYKLSAGAKLPGLGGPAALWRPALRAALPDGGLVVDMRSGSYTSMWAPCDGTVVSVRAFTAERKVISHMVKATRGDVARLLLSAPGRAPRRPSDVAEIVAASGREVELTEGKGGWTLDVIEA
jgi:cytoplasmic iron level regulating protein YaaA (DUF328/UPF0246 family)